MKKLLVDTSGPKASIGIFDGEKPLYESSIDSHKDYNRLLIPMIEEGLCKSGLSAGDIDIFGSTLGPGSFTGIRVGVAAMKGMAQAAGKKFAGVSTLDIIALSAGCAGIITALIGAGRNEFYAANYKAGLRTGPYMLLKKDEAEVMAAENVQFAVLEGDPYLALLPEKSVKFVIKGVSMRVFNDIIIISPFCCYNKKHFFQAEDGIRDKAT